MTAQLPANIDRHTNWHRFGTRFPEPTTPSEGLSIAGLDYQIIKAPMSGQISTPFGTQLIPVNNKMVLFREPTEKDPTHRFLGTCGPDYEIAQSTDIALALDQLAEVWPLETMGATGNGKTMFVTLDAGMTMIKGEEMRQYFMAVNTTDGGTSLKIAYTPIVVFCTNAVLTSLASATVSAILNHKQGLIDTFGSRVTIIQKLQKASFTTNQAFEALASASISEEGIRKVLDFTYPMPNKPKKMTAMEGIEDQDLAVVGQLYLEAGNAAETWEYYCQRQQGFQTLAQQLFARVNDERPLIAGTPWALYNAIVESADFRKGSETVSESAIFGTRATEKKNAFKAVMSLIA